MANYDWVLFDADETLFDFDSFRGLSALFRACDAEFSENDFAIYRKLNHGLWVQFQQGAITAQQLAHARFAPWAKRLRRNTAELQSGFLQAMLEISKPLAGAHDLVRALHRHVRLGIITNGFAWLQPPRLQKAGMTELFDVVVVSEEVGVAKPHPGIFAHALGKMGQPAPERVLMVGDNLTSDIAGGRGAGLHTCWFNARRGPRTAGIVPTYEIASLSAIAPLVLQAA